MSKKINAAKVENSVMNIPMFPEKGFLRLPQVLQLIPISKASWWRWVASGKAPKAVK